MATKSSTADIVVVVQGEKEEASSTTKRKPNDDDDDDNDIINIVIEPTNNNNNDVPATVDVDIIQTKRQRQHSSENNHDDIERLIDRDDVVVSDTVDVDIQPTCQPISENDHERLMDDDDDVISPDTVDIIIQPKCQQQLLTFENDHDIEPKRQRLDDDDDDNGVPVDVDIEPKRQPASDDGDISVEEDDKIECDICDVRDCKPERYRCNNCEKKLCLHFEFRGRMNNYDRENMPVPPFMVRRTLVAEMKNDEYTCIECRNIDFTGADVSSDYLVDQFDKRCSKCHGRVMYVRELTKLIVNKVGVSEYEPSIMYSFRCPELNRLMKDILEPTDNDYVCCMCRNYGYYGPIKFDKPEKDEYGLAKIL